MNNNATRQRRPTGWPWVRSALPILALGITAFPLLGIELSPQSGWPQVDGSPECHPSDLMEVVEQLPSELVIPVDLLPIPCRDALPAVVTSAARDTVSIAVGQEESDYTIYVSKVSQEPDRVKPLEFSYSNGVAWAHWTSRGHNYAIQAACTPTLDGTEGDCNVESRLLEILGELWSVNHRGDLSRYRP